MKKNFSDQLREQLGDENVKPIDLTNLEAYDSDVLGQLTMQLRIKNSRIHKETRELAVQVTAFQREKERMFSQIRFYSSLIQTLDHEIKERETCAQSANTSQPATS